MTTRSRRFVYRAAIASTAVIASIAALAIAQQFTPSADPIGADAPTAKAVTIASPRLKRIVEWDEYTGRFAAVDDVEIRARVSGYLTEIAFTDGEIVKAGDLLFRIDPRPFAAELAVANATLAHSEAVYRYANSEAQRGKKLVKQHALSEEEGDRREREVQEAEADRAAARASVVQAELNLEFTEVRAPVTGRVSDNFVSVGNLIVGGAANGTLLTTVVSLDPIYFEFTASEAEYLKYRRLALEGSRESGRDTHHPVRIKLMDEDNFGHNGYLTFIDNQLDHSTGTMRGRATLANPDGIFAPGMFGRLQLLGSGEYEALLISDTAVQTDQAEKFVWIATPDDTAEQRTVVLGPLVDGERVIREGLAIHDRIIIGGTQFIRDSTPIVPQTAPPQTALSLR